MKQKYIVTLQKLDISYTLPQTQKIGAPTHNSRHCLVGASSTEPTSAAIASGSREAGSAAVFAGGTGETCRDRGLAPSRVIGTCRARVLGRILGACRAVEAGVARGEAVVTGVGHAVEALDAAVAGGLAWGCRWIDRLWFFL